MKQTKTDNTWIVSCTVILAFAILSVGLFFAAAKYANRPAGSGDVLVGTETSDFTSTTDVTTDTGSNTVTDIVTDTDENASSEETVPSEGRSPMGCVSETHDSSNMAEKKVASELPQDVPGTEGSVSMPL